MRYVLYALVLPTSWAASVLLFWACSWFFALLLGDWDVGLSYGDDNWKEMMTVACALGTCFSPGGMGWVYEKYKNS